jgi:hypothetical protein
LGRQSGNTRTRERLLGLRLGLLADTALDGTRPLLTRAVSQVGEGDLDRGVALLRRTATMLMTEDLAVAADHEKYAVEVAARANRPGGALDQGLKRDLVLATSTLDAETVMTMVEPTVAERYEAVDIEALGSLGDDLTAAYLVDVHQTRPPFLERGVRG